MRKVCVVSNVIGNRDVIHNGENGFVCSNTEEFVKAIKEAQNGADGFTERALSQYVNRNIHFWKSFLSMMGQRMNLEKYVILMRRKMRGLKLSTNKIKE